jgi:hypothetical protein
VCPANRNLFDDFVGFHANISLAIHFVPVFNSTSNLLKMFLPWHRVYTQLMQYAIQTCEPQLHANATIPFWDPSVMDGSLSDWDGFNSNYFGGNQSDADGCLSSGPFTGQKPYPWEHCFKLSMALSLIEENVLVERMLGAFYGNPRSTAGYIELTTHVEITLHAGFR